MKKTRNILSILTALISLLFTPYALARFSPCAGNVAESNFTITIGYVYSIVITIIMLTSVSFIVPHFLLARKIGIKKTWMLLGFPAAILVYAVMLYMERFDSARDYNITIIGLVIAILLSGLNLYHFTYLIKERALSTILWLLSYIVLIFTYLTTEPDTLPIYVSILLLLFFVLTSARIFVNFLKLRGRDWELIFVIYIIPFIYLPILALHDKKHK